MRTETGFGATVMRGSPSPLPAVAHAPHSAWQSPVPYLFGGLAAMLGLVAFALLILACSYLKLSGYLDEGDEGGDAQGGYGKPGEPPAKPTEVLVQQFVVIMAGDQNPTALATPISSRASYLGDNPNDGKNESTGVGDGKKTEGGVRGPGGDATQDQDDPNPNEQNQQN